MNLRDRKESESNQDGTLDKALFPEEIGARREAITIVDIKAGVGYCNVRECRRKIFERDACK